MDEVNCSEYISTPLTIKEEPKPESPLNMKIKQNVNSGSYGPNRIPWGWQNAEHMDAYLTSAETHTLPGTPAESSW